MNNCEILATHRHVIETALTDRALGREVDSGALCETGTALLKWIDQLERKHETEKEEVA